MRRHVIGVRDESIGVNTGPGINRQNRIGDQAREITGHVNQIFIVVADVKRSGRGRNNSVVGVDSSCRRSSDPYLPLPTG